MAFSFPIRVFLAVYILSCIFACDRATRDLEGHFFPLQTRTANQFNPAFSNKETGSSLGQESFLDFFKNGTYGIYLNQFEQGKYSYRNDTITLMPDGGTPWEVEYIEDGELGHFHFPQAQKITSLRKVSNDLKANYPFHPDLQSWRVKSNRSLSNNELLEKFQNYAAFMQAYMRWAKQNNLSLRFNRLSGPLQYANNGLMMRKQKETKAWCEYFYEGDCVRMDILLRKYFDGLIIDWKYTNNRILMLIDALAQVSEGINVHKEHFPEE